MGSRVWANDAAQRGATIVGALSLETMGFFTEAPYSQRYPFPMGAFYPDQGNSLAFIGNVDSRALVRETVKTFREVGSIPAEGMALPDHTALSRAPGEPAIPQAQSFSLSLSTLRRTAG